MARCGPFAKSNPSFTSTPHTARHPPHCQYPPHPLPLSPLQSAGFELVRCPIPTPARGEVLLKVLACSLCGTDTHVYDWEPPFSHRVKPPITTGHEVCGQIIAFGPSTSSPTSPPLLSLVSVESHIPCRCLPSRSSLPPCSQCRLGHEHICQHVTFFSVDRDGFLAEYATAPLYLCIPNPAGLPWEVQALKESLGNSVYTVSTAAVRDEVCAVFGLGPTGLNVVAVAKAKGARKVIAVGGTAQHRQLAQQMGADVVIDRHKEDVLARLKEETEGEGAAVCFEMSGATSALQQALDCVRCTGQVSVLGLYGKPMEINLNQAVVLKDVQLRGVYGRRMWSTWEEMQRLLDEGLDVRPLITDRFEGLQRWEEGFEAMKKGSCGKVVFFPHGAPRP